MYRLITKTLLSPISRGSRATSARVCLCAILAASAASAQEAAVWTSTSGGTLGGSTFAVAGHAPFGLATNNFDSADYGSTPLTAVSSVGFFAQYSYTITFSPPLNNPSIYALNWGGTSQGPTYTFGSSPNIVSGFSSATLSGNDLICPFASSHDGILEFSGVVSTITVEAHATSSGLQHFTIAIPSDPCAPAAIADIFEENDSCATATLFGNGHYPGLTVSKQDKDFYEFNIPQGAILNVDATFASSNGDIDMFLRYAGDSTCGMGFGSTILNAGPTQDDNETLSWQNSFPATARVILEVQVLDTPANSDCNTYDLTVFIDLGFPCSSASTADLFEDNDSCAEAVEVTNGTYTGLAVSKTDKDHYSFCVPPGETLNVDALFTNVDGDIDLYLRLPDDINCGTGPNSPALTQGSTSTDNEHVNWTNLNADTTTVILEVQVWDVLSNPDCNTYDLIVLGNNCSPFQIFCDDNNTNCAGMPTLISGQLNGSPGSGLHLEATQGPPNQFGFFLVSAGKTEPGIMISNGSLCLGTGTEPFARYSVQGGIQNSIGQFSSDGSVFNNLTGTATSSGGTGFDVPSVVPFSGVNDPSIMPGSTWHFQLWHRDGCTVQGESNFSNGLSVTF